MRTRSLADNKVITDCARAQIVHKKPQVFVKYCADSLYPNRYLLAPIHRHTSSYFDILANRHLLICRELDKKISSLINLLYNIPDINYIE